MSPPDVSFHGQFFDLDARIGEVLRDLLDDPAFSELTVVVAWARYRGLARIEKELEAFRERGESTIIVGIDENGATRPGLVAAARLFSNAFVYHDRGAGTFHPKVYLAGGTGRAALIVGSSNATPGGLFLNIEASLLATFELPCEAAHPALADARQFIASLLDDTDVCRELTDALIDEMVGDGTVRPDEAPRERHRKIVVDVDADGSAEPGAADQPAFGHSKFKKPGVPPLSAAAKAELASYDQERDADAAAAEQVEAGDVTSSSVVAPPPVVPSGSGSGGPNVGGLPVAKQWNKVLPRGDAQQQTNPSTNVTGNIRLTKAGHDINWRTWFRDDLFAAPAVWSPAVDSGGQPIETADIPMDVTIGGVSQGQMTFHVSHAPHRESGQANHTTVLHWGPLMQTLTANDHTGDVVTISRLNGGGFVLTIA